MESEVDEEELVNVIEQVSEVVGDIVIADV
jgi:hypothetical protein